MTDLPEPFYERDGITIYVGDNRDVLPHIEPVHAVVTDPPYGLSFMGKGWDHQVPGVEFWQAISEAILPGAHMLAFGGTRTFHRMAVAIEDAGYEIRDTLQWIYGSGFPKSHDVSKAIDKMAGAEREVIGTRIYGDGKTRPNQWTADGSNEGWKRPSHLNYEGDRSITAPATPEAEQWQGWGTALKPAYEPVIMARKPFKGTVAQNVLAHGTGAINVDASRIGTTDDLTARSRYSDHPNPFNASAERRAVIEQPAGRWPANVLLDEEAAEGHEWSRYFYVAKASRRERNAGLDGMPERVARPLGISNWKGQTNGSGETMGVSSPAANSHPTVKPLALMRYLIQMVTPPGGIVLDPFAGSGSTLVAAAELGFHAIGIELSEEYAEIAARRVDHAIESRSPQLELEVAS